MPRTGNCRNFALRVVAWLRSKGFPDPVLACSGNGWHILYKLNHLLPTEHPLLEDVLRAVWHQFLSEPVCVIDISLAEPEQVIKAYGTESRKTPAGHPDIDIRPWRKSYLESVPSIIAPVLHSTLESVAALAPLESRTNHKGGSGLPLHPNFDETEWWEHYEDAFVPLTTEGGQAVIHNGYQVTNICPFTYRGEGTGHRHTGSTFTGVKFDEGQPECHCFSDDHCDLSFGDLTRHLNQYHEPYPGPIWDHGEEDDHSDFAEPVGIEDVVPQPPPIKPNGHDTKPCPFGVHKTGECMCTISKEEVAESARKVKQENERRKPERDAHKARMAEARSDIREAEDSEPEPEQPPQPEAGSKEFNIGESTNAEGVTTCFSVIKASAVVMERAEWWWPDRIPKGKISIFAGVQGSGKTFASVDFVARLSTGRDFPDGSKDVWGAREVLFASSEDDPNDTLVPRLAVAGADLDKVGIILWTTGKKIDGREPRKRQRMLQLNKDTKVLKAALRENPNIALIVVDPLTSYFGADSNKDSEIRPIMDTLSATCRESKVAFVGIMHYGKDASRAALQRILGASSIVGSARTVWTFSRDPEDKTERFMSCAKNNLSKNHSGMKYTIREQMLMFPDGKEGPVGYVEWLAETEEDADEVMAKEREQTKNPKNPKLEAAKLLVRTELAKGEQRASLMYRLGEAQAITSETMRDAYRSLGVRPYQKSGAWWWALPGMEVRENTSSVQEASIGDTDAL